MTADPAWGPEPIAFGQRMEILRNRRGMSRTVLAGLVGRSASWVKAVETGRLHTPRLAMILRVAEALRVDDLSELTGDMSLPVRLFAGPCHPRMPAVRAAVDAYPLRAEGEAPPLDHLAQRLNGAWAARHSAPRHRELLGRLLPDLIGDAQLAVRQAGPPADRRAAQSTLAGVYALAQFFLAHQPDASLMWRVAERGMVAAQESGDPHAVGVAAWLLAEAHRDCGRDHLEAADAVTREALAYLEPLLPTAGDDVVAITGALWFAAAYTAARRGEAGTAWGHWDTARRVAERLPDGYFHPVTSFGRAVLGAHAVTVAVELRSGGESVRQIAAADRLTIPSRPRRARHRIEAARGYHLTGRTETALATLAQAHRAAPETLQYNGFARRIVLEATEATSPTLRRRAGTLAVRLGVLNA